jgi:hypothetical protein
MSKYRQAPPIPTASAIPIAVFMPSVYYVAQRN